MSAGLAAGGLLVCPTPIGNLDDITLRTLAALREADILACEDTRHSRLLLERHGIQPPELVSYHEHNEAQRAEQLIDRMRSGATVALLSDAGMPLISDPGYRLVHAALQGGVQLIVLPGPSAVTAALIASGLPCERFSFAGFLPRRRNELAQLLGQLPQTLVAFESPRRLAQTLLVLAEVDPGRQLAVCRELTKLHEEVRRGSARELAGHYREQPARGEVTLVVAAAPPQVAAHADALAALRDLLAAGARPRPAAAVVAKLTGIAANELYGELTAGR